MDLKIHRQLNIQYDKELDLENIHNLMVSLFEETKASRIKKVRRAIKLAQREEPETNVEIEALEERLNKLNLIKSDIKTGVDCQNYIEEVTPILKTYKMLEGISEGSSESSEESSELVRRKKKLINEFISVLQNYITVDVKKTGIGAAEKPTSENRKTNNCEDTDRKNFHKAFLEFQGKLNIKIPDDLLKKIDKYMESYGFVTRKEAVDLPLDSNGKKEGTNRKLMELALKKTKNQSYYGKINMICSIYWGWKLPDLSSLESRIMSDFDRTQKIFKSLQLGRSNLGIQYRLYKHLEQYKPELKELGYNFSKKDFKIVDTREIILEYEEIWKQMAKGAGLLPIETV